MVKHELGDHFESCDNAKTPLFDYVDVFHSQCRRHSTLGQIGAVELQPRLITTAAKLHRLRNRIKPGHPGGSTS